MMKNEKEESNVDIFKQICVAAHANVKDVIIDKNELIAIMKDGRMLYMSFHQAKFTKEQIKKFEFETSEEAEQFRRECCDGIDKFAVEKQNDTGLFKLVYIENKEENKNEN